MLFNELIEEEGLESVVSKTNISNINLNYLLDGSFEKLNRVKALGFLLILEREYKEIDVSNLRETIKTYYDENAPVDDKVVMVARGSTTGDGFSFFKFFIITGLIVGAYYLFTQGKLDSIIQKLEDKKDFFDDTKALENNVSSEDAKKVVVGKLEVESVEIETLVVPKTETVDLDDNSSSKDIEPLAIVHIESVVAPVEEVEKNQSVESVVKEVTEDFLAEEAKTNSDEENESVVVETTVPTITTVSINPTRGMLWYGFINLETKKRREFMKRVATPFEINNGKWLLVTGHGYLDIIADAKTLEISDNKKHYFYIDGSDIKEIARKEFRELNGNRGW